MKVHQIISERSLLNEFAPLVAVGGLMGVLGLVSAYITGLTLREIHEFIKNYNEDPDKITEEQWDDIFLDIMLIAVPGFAKLGKATLIKVLPRSWIRSSSQSIRKKIYDKMKKDQADANRRYGPGAQAGRSPADAARLKKKHEALRKKARERAKKRVDSFDKKVWAVFSAGVGTALVVEYYERLENLEAQYEAWKNGDRETELFTDLEDPARVDELARQERKKILGQATLAIGSAIASLPVAKGVSMLGNIFGKVAEAGTGLKLAGGLVQLPFVAAAKLIKHGGPGLGLFLSTETGRKAIEFLHLDWLLTTTGNVTDKVLNLIYDGIDALAKQAGINATVPRSQIQDPVRTGKDEKGADVPAMLDKTPRSLKVQIDPKNPKIKYIGGVQVTDEQGFQSVGNNYLNQIKREAEAIKLPDPTAGIPKKPGVNYNY